jgi:N-glycosidase YbiA
MTILFCDPNIEPYGCFSNFANYPFTLDDMLWQSVEHFYQASKYEGTPYLKIIQSASDSKEAYRLSKQFSEHRRPDFKEYKLDYMKRGTMQKFKENPDILKILLETGDETIIERCGNDIYWGQDENGVGENNMGKILMQVREYFRHSQ